jgi:predicted component of type VI protein secretion system
MGLLRKLAGVRGNAEDDEIHSILDNLNHMLNTTRDFGAFLHNFGISDYTYLCTREDIAKALIAEISENIALFEPRVALNRIVVNKEDKLLRLSFRIDFVLRDQLHSVKLFLDPIDHRFQYYL